MIRNPMNYNALDFETADARHDSACAIGIVLVRAGKVFRRLHFLIKPPRAPSALHVRIHGLAASVLVGEPSFAERWHEIRNGFKGADFWCSHGAFDASVLRTCCAKIGVRPPRQPHVDTVVLVREVWGLVPATLQNASKRLRLPLQHHNALSDANASARIVDAAGAENVRQHLANRSERRPRVRSRSE